MQLTANKEILITIVVVQRQRFSMTREALESLYEHTQIPFRLVYVDGGSPSKYRRYLKTQSKEKGFKLIRFNHYLMPNRARNIGLHHVDTKYVVLIENDVIVKPGWLKAMVQCAEQTQAAVVAPLTCERSHKYPYEVVHCAGGECGVGEVESEGKIERHIIERVFMCGRRPEGIRGNMQRQKITMTELHCALVRTDIFERVGLLDELLTVNEDYDFFMSIQQIGEPIYFEPASVVTFIRGPLLEWNDIPFYLLRWNDRWEAASWKHLLEKWNLTEDDYFARRYRDIGVRKRHYVVEHFCQKPFYGRFSDALHKMFLWLERILDRTITNFYERSYAHRTKEELPYITTKFGTGKMDKFSSVLDKAHV